MVNLDIDETPEGHVAHEVSQCEFCQPKDSLIVQKDEQIRDLRKRLLKAQKKIWKIEKTKTKLTDAISSLKDGQLLNEELCMALEVFTF